MPLTTWQKLSPWLFVAGFVLLALVIFWMVKAINRVRASVEAPKEAAPAPPPEDVVLLREIRDELKRRG